MTATRKIFRFKYEPCNGTCYAWCEALVHCLRNDPDHTQLVNMMVEAHEKLCDNPDYSFGVDFSQKTGVYVAHFRTPDKLNVFASTSFREVVEDVCAAVMDEDIPFLLASCIFGGNGTEDLGREILRFCTDEGVKLLAEHHCECKAHPVAV